MAMAAGLEELAAAMEEAVELVDEEVGRLVSVLGGHGSEKVGPADFDMAFGYEDGASARGVVFKVDTDPINAGLVTKQAFGLGAKRVPEGVGEGEVNTAKENLRAGVGGMRMYHRPVPTGGGAGGAV